MRAHSPASPLYRCIDTVRHRSPLDSASRCHGYRHYRQTAVAAHLRHRCQYRPPVRALVLEAVNGCDDCDDCIGAGSEAGDGSRRCSPGDCSVCPDAASCAHRSMLACCWYRHCRLDCYPSRIIAWTVACEDIRIVNRKKYRNIHDSKHCT
jgi:hypothetical protein